MDIDKSQVALRFAQATTSYTAHAVVQKQIGQRLLQLIQHAMLGDAQQQFAWQGLEIGCGSGHLSHLLLQHFNFESLFLNDLYVEVQQHFEQNLKNKAALRWLIGDIEQLDFPPNLNLIASSSVLQWLSDLDAVLAKSVAALRSRGFLCFSSFGPQNLHEIKALTGQGLVYLEKDDLAIKLQQQGFELLHLSEDVQSLYFDHPQQVLKHLKATGVTATAQQYRWTKQSLQQFYQDYLQFSSLDSAGKLQYSLRYHPIYCIARRKT